MSGDCVKNSSNGKTLFKILNLILLICICISIIFVTFLVGNLAKSINLDWLNQSYFSKITSFDWLTFICQFILIETIFLLIFSVFFYAFEMFKTSLPKFLDSNFKHFSVIYFATSLSVSLSLTMTEIVFVTLTSIVAFAVLIAPVVAQLFIFLKKEVNEPTKNIREKPKNHPRSEH